MLPFLVKETKSKEEEKLYRPTAHKIDEYKHK
jgi:hypothetical protein